MNSGLFSFSPLPLGEGRVRAVESPAAMPEKLIAASAPQAGHFFLSGQEKVTKKKAAPEPPKSTCASRRSRGLPDGTSLCRWQVRAPCANRAARGLIRLRLRCSAAATGPNVNSDTIHRKAGCQGRGEGAP